MTKPKDATRWNSAEKRREIIAERSRERAESHSAKALYTRRKGEVWKTSGGFYAISTGSISLPHVSFLYGPPRPPAPG